MSHSTIALEDTYRRRLATAWYSLTALDKLIKQLDNDRAIDPAFRDKLKDTIHGRVVTIVDLRLGREKV